MENLFAFSLLLLLLAASGCRREVWMIVQPSNRTFSVQFPQQPQKTEVSTDTPCGKIEMTHYSTTQREVTLMLSYSDYPAACRERIPQARLLDAGMEKLSAQYPYAQIVKADTIIQGFPARTAFMNDPTTKYTMICKSLLVDSRLYALQGLRPSSVKDRGEIDRFFDSFKIGLPQGVKTDAIAGR